jgi:hypothetical protein
MKCDSYVLGIFYSPHYKHCKRYPEKVCCVQKKLSSNFYVITTCRLLNVLAVALFCAKCLQASGVSSYLITDVYIDFIQSNNFHSKDLFIFVMAEEEIHRGYMRGASRQFDQHIPPLWKIFIQNFSCPSLDAVWSAILLKENVWLKMSLL